MTDFLERDLEWFAQNPHRRHRFRPLFENETYHFFDGVAFDPRTHGMWRFLRLVKLGVLQRFTACVDLAGARATADDEMRWRPCSI